MTKKQINLADRTDEELVIRFADLSRRHRALLMTGPIRKINETVMSNWEVGVELKQRGPDSLKKLGPLLDDPNVQVRLDAARVLLPVAYHDAKRALEQIANLGDYPATADARWTLARLAKEERDVQ